MRIKTILNQFLTLLFSSALCSFSVNQSIQAADLNHYQMSKFSLKASLGYLGGESNEYVYDTDGTKLSQLNWVLDGAPIFALNFNSDLFSWLSLGVDLWGTTDQSAAVMDDYDWLIPSQSRWSDWSHHVNTNLNNASQVDVNVRPWLFQNQTFKLGAIIGYQKTELEFLAKGGCFVYDNGLYTGCSDANEPAIGYQQIFEGGYFGFTSKYLMSHIELDATLKVSPWVSSSDKDEHYSRNLTFYESGNQSIYASLSVTAGYYFTQNIKAFLEGSLTQFTNGKADTVIDYKHGQDLYYIPDAAGLGHHNYVLALGVQYLNND